MEVVEVEIKEYKLHGREGNSFHFRLVGKNTVSESFSVTYAYDGTAIMSGDMGNMMWKRNYFPNGNHDYGFPNNDTGIAYFAEKIKCALCDQVLKKFSVEKAKKDIREEILGMALDEYAEDSEKYKQALEKVEDFLKYNSGSWEEWTNQEVNRTRMYEDLCDEYPDYEWTESMEHIGMEWDNLFEYRFEILKSVSGLIMEAIKEETQVPLQTATA